jgi:hypothetical protein
MTEVIKKVIIKNKTLPPVTFDDNSLFYSIRYRVISEDKNRVSQWSPTYKLQAPTATSAGLPYDGAVSPERFHINVVGNTINAVWSFKPIAQNPTDLEKIFAETASFDVWTRWNPNASPSNVGWTAWEKVSTVSTNSFSTLKKTTGSPLQVQIAVQIPTNVKVRDDRLTLFIGKSSV